MRNMKIAELIFNRPLMISESKLNVILHVLGPRFNLDLSGMPREESAVLSDQERGRAGYTVQDGIATIGIYGPLMNRVLRSEFPSGGPTSYADIRSAFDTALADSGVKEIKFEIDSPGGDVAGAFDLADHIYESRGLKPITAVVNESACSAAYLIASAAGKVVATRTAYAGSIGVIMTHADFSRAEDQAGVTVTHIYAGARKADFSQHQPISDAARSDAQSMVNSTYDLFVSTVARNRNMSEAAVRGTEAGLYRGPKAVEMGLVDEIMPAAKALAKRSVSQDMPMGPVKPMDNQSATGGTASAETLQGEERMTKAELKEKYPALFADVFSEGRSEGMTAGAEVERARIVGILEMPGPGAKAHAGLLIEGVKSGASAGDVALNIQRKEGELLSGAMDGIKEGAVKPAPVVDPPAEGGQNLEAGVTAIMAGAQHYNDRR